MAYVSRENPYTVAANGAAGDMSRIILAAPEIKRQQLMMQLEQEDASRRGALMDAQKGYYQARTQGQVQQNEGANLLGTLAKEAGDDLARGDMQAFRVKLPALLNAGAQNPDLFLGMFDRTVNLMQADPKSPRSVMAATYRNPNAPITDEEWNAKNSKVVGSEATLVDPTKPQGQNVVYESPRKLNRGQGLFTSQDGLLQLNPGPLGANQIMPDALNPGGTLAGPAVVSSGGMYKAPGQQPIVNTRPVTDNMGNYMTKLLELIYGPDSNALDPEERKELKAEYEDLRKRRAAQQQGIDLSPDPVNPYAPKPTGKTFNYNRTTGEFE